MPWKVSDPASERLEFVKRWLDGERVADLCREYGVSRKTTYKMRARYEEFGPRGLFGLSRARKTQCGRTPPEVEQAVRSFLGHDRQDLAAPEYPLHDEARRVHSNGQLWLEKGHCFKLTAALAGETVGVREVNGNRCLVTFMQLDLGHYDFNTSSLSRTLCQTGRREPPTELVN